jgi:GTP-binding protein Era
VVAPREPHGRCQDDRLTMLNDKPSYRSGLAGLLGQTNVGKSTFLNAVMREKLVITSAKPQTTRNNIRCVLSTEEAQVIFVDTPGLHAPRTKLSHHLTRETYRSLRELDVLVYMVEPSGRVDEFDRRALGRLEREECPHLLIVNKIDIAKGNALEETLLAYAALDRFEELIPVSARTGVGLDDALRTIISYLPATPPLFPPDVRCDRAEGFMIEELIREKATDLTYEEIPYSIAVRVKWIHEREDGLVEIRAEIVVDRDSQKGILIGKGAHLIRRIGTTARADIERMLGRRVFLDLTVSVESGWTNNDAEIRQLTGTS